MSRNRGIVSKSRWTGSGALLGVLMLLMPSTAARAQDCEGTAPRPWLGIERFHCPGGICRVLGATARTSNVPPGVVMTHVRSPHLYDFSVEPSVWGIHPDGPADGKLEDGDVLVAVNGRAVTTAQASEELDALEAGEPVRLTVRRGSRLLNVEVTPTRSCQRVWLSAGTDAEAPEVGRRAAVQQHLDSLRRSRRQLEADAQRRLAAVLEAARAAAARRTGPGFLGVAIRCGDCVLTFSADAGGSEFRFEEYPEVVEVVEGSLAERTGLRPGDLLTHVDGKDLRTEEGADRLAKLVLRPGERLEIRYIRDGEARTGVAAFDPDRER